VYRFFTGEWGRWGRELDIYSFEGASSGEREELVYEELGCVSGYGLQKVFGIERRLREGICVERC